MNTGTVLVDVAVKDLSGAALDWAVAVAVHGKVYCYPDGGLCPPEGSISLNEDDGSLWTNIGGFHHGDQWQPSTDWRQGGPLIDRHDVELMRFGEQEFYERDPQWNQKPCVGAVVRSAPGCTYASIHIEECMTGETCLIAACRAIVASKLGDIVKVPACLVLP